MCDYDYCDYQHFTTKEVTTRVVHECGGCLNRWPAGTRMKVHTGKTEGELSRSYVCPVCDFASKQEDHTPLHICYGDMWDSSFHTGLEATWEHIRRCFARGRKPNERLAARLRCMDAVSA